MKASEVDRGSGLGTILRAIAGKNVDELGGGHEARPCARYVPFVDQRGYAALCVRAHSRTAEPRQTCRVLATSARVELQRNWLPGGRRVERAGIYCGTRVGGDGSIGIGEAGVCPSDPEQYRAAIIVDPHLPASWCGIADCGTLEDRGIFGQIAGPTDVEAVAGRFLDLTTPGGGIGVAATNVAASHREDEATEQN